MTKELLEKYAELAVKVGINIQPGQILRINTPIEAADLARLCQTWAYRLGAKKVIISFRDELVNKIDLELASQEALCEFPAYKTSEMNYLIDNNAALLSIYAETPGLLKDIDAAKLQAVAIANSTNLKPLQEYSMSGAGQWSLVSYPTGGWAKKVFPDCSESEAIDKLWENILLTARVDKEGDAIANWATHNQEMAKHNDILNSYNLDYLVFKNELGTDLKVHLAENHRWAGGSEKALNGIVFNPNIPTEECFSMPYKTKVDGKVVATKPLNYQGKLIEDFWLVFQDGKVVDYDAAKEKEALKSLLEFDEGSSYLGEVALISHDSPISQTGILFFNTLFDENASCHLALGCAYPMNIIDAESKSEEELFALGFNKSLVHEDFMFGSREMCITGYDKSGREIEIFKRGNFVF